MTARRLLASLYFLGVVVYTTWGTIEGQGLPGYLTGWMLARFGVSWDEVAATLTGIALLTPLLLSRRWLGIDRASSRAEMGLLYLALILLPALLGWMGEGYLVARDARETSLPLERFSLREQPLPWLAPGPHLVRLEGGYLLGEAQHTVREDYGETHQRFIPFAASAETTTLGFVLVMEQRGTAPALLHTPGTPLSDPDADWLPPSGASTVAGLRYVGDVRPGNRAGTAGP